jgi:hypothetical protein
VSKPIDLSIASPFRMQARGVLPQQIEVEDHIEILEEREAEVTQWVLAVTVSQFGPRQNMEVCVISPCNKDHAVL